MVFLRVSSSVLTTVVETVMRAEAGDASVAARDAAIRGADAICPRASAAGGWLARALKGPTAPMNSSLRFMDGACNRQDLAWLSWYEYFSHVCGLRHEREALSGLTAIASGVDWFIPYKSICWVSERPVLSCSDTKGRLHNATGPALRYRDGWSIYAWKSIEVPRRFIEEPHTITLAEIDAATDFQLRRCMIERLTPERYIAMGGAIRLCEDEAGVLWRRTWPDGDAWAAVEVENGTPEPDGQAKRYFLQVPPQMPTARAAVAWTYGLTAMQYQGLVQRT